MSDGKRKLLRIAVAAAIVLSVAWAFRFQALPGVSAGAFVNRWTGTVYFIGGGGDLRVAREASKDE